MQLTSFEKQKIVKPALCLLAAIVLALALSYWVQTRYQAAIQAHQQQNSALQTATQRYLASGQEKLIIDTFLPEYQQMIEDGFVGEERRIEWVEQLKQIHQRHKLFGIDYTIGSQQKYMPAFLPNSDTLNLQRSVMQLRLSMLHEGDLLHLLNDLKSAKNSPTMVRDCEIFNVGDTSATNQTLSPRMEALCQIDWLTMHEQFETAEQNTGAQP